MVTMTTTLIILGRNNLNEMEIYLTLWMWWRMWQIYATTMTQMMMKVTTTTLMMKTPLHKLKEYSSYPHTSGRMGAMARDCPIGVEVFLLLLLHA